MQHDTMMMGQMVANVRAAQQRISEPAYTAKMDQKTQALGDILTGEFGVDLSDEKVGVAILALMHVANARGMMRLVAEGGSPEVVLPIEVFDVLTTAGTMVADRYEGG